MHYPVQSPLKEGLLKLFYKFLVLKRLPLAAGLEKLLHCGEVADSGSQGLKYKNLKVRPKAVYPKESEPPPQRKPNNSLQQHEGRAWGTDHRGKEWEVRLNSPTFWCTPKTLVIPTSLLALEPYSIAPSGKENEEKCRSDVNTEKPSHR